MTMHILENAFKDHYYMQTIIFQRGRFIFFIFLSKCSKISTIPVMYAPNDPQLH